jgi:hypothetical protein
MTRTELGEFRRLRWRYLKTGSGRILRSGLYNQLYMNFWTAAERLNGIQRVIYIYYYNDVRSITYIAMHLNYSERSVKRIKRMAVFKVTE